MAKKREMERMQGRGKAEGKEIIQRKAEKQENCP
jgi:hypothetical protein